MSKRNLAVTVYYPCVCCGGISLPDVESLDSYGICEQCGWFHDSLYFNDLDYKGGASRLSLLEAGKSWKLRDKSKDVEDKYIDLKLIKHGYYSEKEYLDACFFMMNKKCDMRDIRGGISEKNGFIIKYRVSSNDLFFSWPDKKTFGMYKPARGLGGYHYIERSHFDLSILKSNYYPCICCGNISVVGRDPFLEEDIICIECGWDMGFSSCLDFGEFVSDVYPRIVKLSSSCPVVNSYGIDPMIDQKMMRLGYGSIENYEKRIRILLDNEDYENEYILSRKDEAGELIIKYDMIANDLVFSWRTIGVRGMFKPLGGFCDNKSTLKKIFGQIPSFE